MPFEKLKSIVGEEVYKKYLEQPLEKDGKDYFFAEGKEFIPLSKFNDVNNANKELKNQLSERDIQLEDLQKSVKGNEELTAEINKLKEINAKNKTDYEAQLLQLEKDHALETTLLNAGSKNKNALKGMLGDISSYEFKDGKFTGLEEKIAQVRKDNSWLFETTVPSSAGKNHITEVEPKNELRKAFGLK